VTHDERCERKLTEWRNTPCSCAERALVQARASHQITLDLLAQAQEEIARLKDLLEVRCTYIAEKDHEYDLLRAQVAQRHYVCEAHVPLGEPGNHDDECPCCEAVHQADQVARLAKLMVWARPHIGDECQRSWPDDEDFNQQLSKYDAALASLPSPK